MKSYLFLFLVFCNFQQISCHGEFRKGIEDKFRLGNEVLLESIADYKDQRIALLTNQTGILPDGTHIIDAFVKKGANIVKIFSPEHGIRGDENYSETDEKTGIMIISLYGGKYKPSPSDLDDVDAVVYDIQDIGARFYTYTSTLYYIIEACKENNKKLIICDRPIVINPEYTDGFVLEGNYNSFVGMIPAPVCYGMTCGELAMYLNGTVFGNAAKIEVKKMQNYSRKTDYTKLGLPWIKPSPNMFYPSTAVCYPASCFLEGTNVSEGRGTSKPFEYFGAPWINSEVLCAELNSYSLAGVKFEPVTFTPNEKISNYPPKFYNKACSGIFINVTDRDKFEAVKCGTLMLICLNKLFPEFKFNKDNFIDKLAGTDKLRKLITGGASLEEISNSWAPGTEEFKKTREAYLLYN